MSDNRVLLVDDDAYLLNAFRRQLRGVYNLETCVSPEEALEKLKSSNDIQVVVSDMQMPTMSGLEFLKQCRVVAPFVIRIMLTGNADQATVINAINDGAVFRFLLKPCESVDLIRTLADAMKAYQEAAAERDAVADTQCSALKLITDVVSSVRPLTFKHSMESRKLASEVAKEMALSDYRMIELAAMLSYFGSISLPEELFNRYLNASPLSVKEKCEIEKFVEFGRMMIGTFPSFDDAEKLIAYQLKSPSALPPIGSRVIRAVNDYLRLSRSMNRRDAIKSLKDQPAIYDADIVEVLEKIMARRFKEVEVTIADLKPGNILVQPIRTRDGLILVEAMQQLTWRILERLRGIIESNRISPTEKVRIIPELLPPGHIDSDESSAVHAA